MPNESHVELPFLYRDVMQKLNRTQGYIENQVQGNKVTNYGVHLPPKLYS